MKFSTGFHGSDRTSALEFTPSDADYPDAVAGHLTLVLQTGDCWVQTYLSAGDARRLAAEILAQCDAAEQAAVVGGA